MKDVLSDIMRQTTGLVDQIKVVGTEAETRIEAHDAEKTMLVQARLKTAVPEFVGEFGIPNIGLLNGLLGFAAYKADDARFTVKRRKRGDREIVEEFQFRDRQGSGADYRLMGTETLPGFKLADIPWDITVTPEKAKLTEFQQLAQLYSEVEKTFGATVQDGRLLFQLGNDSSSTHRATMVFAEKVTGEITCSVRWSIARFKDVMKIAGASPSMSLTSRGVLRVSVETPHGLYDYFLLGDQRR